MLRLRTVISLAAAVAVAACQERLASPADCPNLCPGSFDIRDTVLYAIDDADSTFTGYLRAGAGSSLRVSHNFPVSEDLPIIRFSPRSDSFPIGTIFYRYTVDSVSLEFSVQFRDSLVPGLKVYLYRLPATVDSTTTYAQVQAAFVPSAILDSFVVEDSLITKRLTRTFKDADLAKVAIPASDSGVLAVGVQIRASAGTGVRIGSASSGSSGPIFRSFISVADTANDTTVARQITPSIRFNSFVTQTPPVIDQSVLTLGGAPSSRAIVRFPWPPVLRDSAQLVRVTMQLVPAETVNGLPTDSAYVVARPVLADLGGKSSTVNDAAFLAVAGMLPGHVDTFGLEIRRSALAWQGENAIPSMMMLQLFPETGSFTLLRLGSSRSAEALRPRLRVTYTLTYPFGNP